MIDSIKSNANIIANTIIAGRDIKMIKLGESESTSSPDAKESQIEHTQGSDPSSSGTFVLPEVDK